ncbi:MAG: DNA cytosine methyltransferase, partial [Mucilaginibacter sp.]
FLEYQPTAWCDQCGNDIKAVQVWKNPQKKFGKFKQQYHYYCPKHGTLVEPYYYAAFNCIDWSDLGQRIGDRKKDLAPKTIARIDYGLKKYGNQPLMITSRYTTGIDYRVKPVTEAMPTQPGDASHTILTPFVIKSEHSQGEASGKVRNADRELQTQTTRQSMAVVTPFIIHSAYSDQARGTEKPATDPLFTQTTLQSQSLVTPFVMEMNSTGECKPASEPTATITAGGINHALVAAPLIIENKNNSKARHIDEPLGCATTKSHHGLLTHESLNSFLGYYYGTKNASHITEPVHTLPTVDRAFLVNKTQPKMEDCYYRMLKPGEIKLGMAFDRDYIVLGSGRDQVKQLGNAVTPPAMEWLVQQVIESLI